MYKLDYSKQFFKDIQLIQDYIALALGNPIASQKIAKEIMDRADALCDFPERYPKQIVNSLVYHRMPIKNFNLFYCVDKNNLTVTIARVLYSGMDINQVAIMN